MSSPAKSAAICRKSSRESGSTWRTSTRGRSTSDTAEEINRKIKVYLQSGVPLVWIVDPDLQSLKVHRPEAGPTTLSGNQEFDGHPHLPGLKFQVRKLFE